MFKTIVGNTNRLTTTFYNFDNEQVNPNLVKFFLKDSFGKVIKEEILGEENKLEIGKYFYDFIADKQGRFIVEFYGEISGKPNVDRELIIVTLLKEK